MPDTATQSAASSETPSGTARGFASRFAKRVLRVVAIVHLAWAAILVLAALWMVVASLSVIPYMSSGTTWSNLPSALLLAIQHAGPPAALGAWMAVLGRRLWRASPGLRRSLLGTHGLLLVPGVLATLLGIQAMGAATRSAERGGGLLSPLAAVPLILGAAILAMAVASIVVALTMLSKEKRQSR